MNEDKNSGRADETQVGASRIGVEKEEMDQDLRGSHEELFREFGFSTFIISLSTSALVNLGELPDPITSKKEVNLQLAKQTISIIEMLQEKTKANLTAEEEHLLGSVLYDVRLKYINASR